MIESTTGSLDLLHWVIEQTPVIVVMSIVIYYLFKYIKDKDAIIKSKDEKAAEMAEKIIAVASLWDTKSTINSKEHQMISDKLIELKEIANQCKTLK